MPFINTENKALNKMPANQTKEVDEMAQQVKVFDPQDPGGRRRPTPANCTLTSICACLKLYIFKIYLLL